MSELAKRVAVAVVGVPTVLALVYLGRWFLAVPLSLFATLGALEVYRFAQATGIRPFRSLGAMGAAALVLLAAHAGTFTAYAPWALGVIGVATAACLAAALSTHGPEGRPLPAVSVTTFGIVYAGASLGTVPLLQTLPTASGWVGSEGAGAAGLALVALPLAATWIGDTAAYFAGSAWGTSKLAPTISPKKRWVGFWAGLAGASVAALVWYAIARPALPGLRLGWAGAAIVGAVLGLGAVLGDLAESLMKREAKVKDSGTFFPGHGGVLDRLDALIVTFPLAYGVLVLTEALQ